jgi:hypothetical protein
MAAPSRRPGVPAAFWNFLFLLGFIDFVVYLLLSSSGTPTDLTAPMISLNVLLVFAAISVYSWIKLSD